MTSQTQSQPSARGRVFRYLSYSADPERGTLICRYELDGREFAEGEKPENVVLEFKPNPAHDMLVACLWSRWTAPDQPDLLSFAAITDDPPPEIAAVGHDRCIIPIKPENIDAWLNPNPKDLASSYAILDDCDRPYYEYRLAA